MNALSIFDFEDQPVRVVERDGEPWWVARDVCNVLGYAKPRAAVGSAALDDDERVSISMDTLGGQQAMTCVNESGLYVLILGSRKGAARKFRKWVTREVLPALRQQGVYKMEQAFADSERGHLARLRALLLATAQDVRAKRLTAGQAQAVAITAGKYLDALKLEGEAIGYEKMLGMRSNGVGNGILPGDERLQRLPQREDGGAAAAESELSTECLSVQEGMAAAEPGEGDPQREEMGADDALPPGPGVYAGGK